MSARDVEILLGLQERGFGVSAGEKRTRLNQKDGKSIPEKEQDKSVTLDVVLDRLRSFKSEKELDDYSQELDKQISESGQSQTQQLLKAAEKLQKYAKWIDQVSAVLKDLKHDEDEDENEGLC